MGVPNLTLPGSADRRSAIGLAALVAVLFSGALLPRLFTRMGVADLPGGGAWEAPILVCFAAILAVAVLGSAFIYLQARCREIAAARDIDSHAALHDTLTGVANRRHFERRLQELVSDSVPEHALIMIDLDRFKPVNDLYGHAAGDALLCDIARGLSRVVAPDDLVARLGGDEFAMLLKNTDIEAAEQTALALLDFVSKYRLNWQGQRVSVGTSIGLVAIDRKGQTAADLLAASDEALYSAKEAGRGAVFSARLQRDPAVPPVMQRIDAGLPEPVTNGQSHIPEDGRRQELHAVVMACLPTEEDSDKHYRQGSRRRHEIKHWLMVEPLTVGDDSSPGMLMRELLDAAAARSDGGADLARWVLISTLDAASRISPTLLGRISFVLPVSARAVVAVPDLAEELMRINALSSSPIRHIVFVLHGVGSVYELPAVEHFYHRLSISGVRLGFEIRASTLDVLAPLRYVTYDELHVGRELSKNLRPGTSASAAVEALLNVAERNATTLVASGVDSVDEVRQLAQMGVDRFAGPVIGQPESLHAVLQGLDDQ